MKPRKDQSSSVDTAAVHPFARNAVLPFPEPDPVLSTLHAKANGPARPSLLSSKANEGTDGQLSFLQAFGVLGLPMVFVVAVCITWTSWLLFLACAPTWTANHLMNTSAFEDGNFWLLIHPAQWLQVLSLIGLALVLLGYTYVLFKMLLWRNHVSSFSESFRQRIESSEHWTKIIVCRLCRWRLGRVLALWRDLTGFSGTKRKFWNLWLKTVDLTLQSIALVQMLQTGFPMNMAYSYAGLIALNALSCVVTIVSRRQSAFLEVLVDSIFDLVFAVAVPIGVLAYSYSNFDFDRDALAINDEVFSNGAFERQARMLADPSEVFLFRTSLNSLRILSMTDWLLRIGMNLSFCYRLKRVVEVQIARRKRARRLGHQRIHSLLLATTAETPVPRAAALLFALFAMLVLVGTHKAITATDAACAAYPECVLHAHRWDAGDLCPCLVLIDEDRVPRTYETWLAPTDVTETVRALARWGELRVLQLINRRLQHLPDELQHCQHLHHLSLVYTETESFPVWATQLTNLNFLHVEGKMGLTSLLHLPDDLFDHMRNLEFLHLGMHLRLPNLPPFTGLVRLKQATFAYLCAVTELPSFAPLTKLERLQLVYFSSVASISDLAPLTKLKLFAVYRPNQICCNGFLGAATCNLSHPFCTANAQAGIPAVTCLQDDRLRVTAATKAVFAKYAASVCQGASAVIPEQPTRATVDMCGGVAYRQCTMPRADNASVLATGICFHTRMQVLACTLDPIKQQMRRLQIQRGVGPVCDPDVEAWLGCQR